MQTPVLQIRGDTVKCLSTGTPKIINFPFVPNGKLIIFTCSRLGHLKSINFPFGTNRKVMVLGVPILKHFRALRII